MSAMSPCGRNLAVGLLLAVATCALAPLGQGQPPSKRTPFFHDAKYCGSCHEPGAAYKDKTQFICVMDEWSRWDKKDKHKNALKALSNGPGTLGGEIGKALGRDVTKWGACLNCHSVFDRHFEVPKPEEKRVNRFNPPYPKMEEEGVSCVACHGRFLQWVQMHPARNDSWRLLSREDKDKQYGMADLWNPVVRLKKCSSCHIGNVEEGKVVTHAMYAAGHPPLPGLEVATFSAAMPYHWEYLKEKVARIKDNADLINMLKIQQPDFKKLEHCELVAVSALVPLRETLALLIAEADETARAAQPDSTMTWPDFARFDCYSCHHDVTRASWRQGRPFADAPGRPPAPDWPTALVEIGVEAAGPDQAKQRLETYRTHLGAFRKALGARPFGDRDRMVEAARALKDWTDTMLEEVHKAKFDRRLALRLLERTCRKASDPEALPDFDTARQLFWAFETIYKEVEPDAAKDKDKLSPIAAVLAGLDSKYDFSLPGAREQVSIESSLKERKAAVAGFDPAAFRAAFAKLLGMLKSE